MKRIPFILLIILSIATGGLFLYSAYTKLFPIQAFEYTMVQYLHLPLVVASIAARFFIGLEFALGGLIVLHLYGKNKWPLKAAFLLIIAFSVYLAWLWAVAGNDMNCGCFGDYIWMSPSTSLIKNGILLLCLWLLIHYHKGFTYKWARISAPLLLIGTIVTLYICLPMFRPYKMDMKAIYADTTLAPAIDLHQGKHIIVFLSPSCGHCRKAAKKMEGMYLKNPVIPFYFIIGGTITDLTPFWQDTKAENIPHTRLAKDPFLKYTGGMFPQIMLVNNGIVEENLDYPDMNQVLLEKWMK
jgi:hypothetical protein